MAAVTGRAALLAAAGGAVVTLACALRWYRARQRESVGDELLDVLSQ